MGLTINSTVPTRWGVIGLGNALKDAFKAAEKLSSGLAINSASDDPSGLIISEQLRSQIGSLNREIENIQMNIGKYETVSSTLGGLRTNLNDLRSMAVAAANDGFNSEEAQEAYATAAQDIINSYNRTVENAEYNGRKTLDGSEGSLASITQLEGIDFSTPEAAAASIDAIDAATRELDTARVEVASTQRNDLESRRASLEVTRQNLIAAESQRRDADYGIEIADYVGGMIRAQASIAILAHSLNRGETVLKLLAG